MKKTDESIKEELAKAEEVLVPSSINFGVFGTIPRTHKINRNAALEQELKGHSESLSFFSAIAFAHKMLKMAHGSAGFPPNKSADPPRTLAGNLRYTKFKKIDLKGEQQNHEHK